LIRERTLYVLNGGLGLNQMDDPEGQSEGQGEKQSHRRGNGSRDDTLDVGDHDPEYSQPPAGIEPPRGRSVASPAATRDSMKRFTISAYILVLMVASLITNALQDRTGRGLHVSFT